MSRFRPREALLGNGSEYARCDRVARAYTNEEARPISSER